MNTRSSGPGPSRIRGSRFALFVLLISLLAAAFTWVVSAPLNIDSSRYHQIAAGMQNDVPRPFSLRVLHPMAVAGLSKLTGISLHVAFRLLHPALLLVLVGACFLTTSDSLANPLLLGVALSVPALTLMVGQPYLPDLPHAAGLALVFLCFARQRHVAVLLLLVPLHLVRESTLLVWVFLIGAYLIQKQRRRAATAFAAALLAITISSYVGRLSQENIHSLPTPVYLAGKTPINLMRNVLGVLPYTDTLAANNPRLFPEPPLRTWQVPESLGLSRLHTVGIYGLSARGPLLTALALMTTFGATPLLLALLFSKGRRHLIDRLLPWQKLALFYGLFCFLMAPLLGAAVGRLATYGWPAFWLAGPILLTHARATSSLDLRKVLPWHLVLCGLGWLQLATSEQEPLFLAFLVTAASACHVAITRIARKIWPPTGSPPLSEVESTS